MGLGFAAIRDVGSFFRSAARDDRGTANPLAGDVRFVYTGCSSQPCRTLHDYVWLGFNEDESGKKVVDGMNNWIGGSTGDVDQDEDPAPGDLGDADANGADEALTFPEPPGWATLRRVAERARRRGRG